MSGFANPSVYDLGTGQGVVHGRAATKLRSIETYPETGGFVHTDGQVLVGWIGVVVCCCVHLLLLVELIGPRDVKYRILALRGRPSATDISTKSDNKKEIVLLNRMSSASVGYLWFSQCFSHWGVHVSLRLMYTIREYCTELWSGTYCVSWSNCWWPSALRTRPPRLLLWVFF